MAKRKKRKKSSIGTSLKYEVYGILLITLSVIALSGEAAVGRSLSKLFGLLLGKFYFVLALVGIYVGLVVMVKRAWPTGWTSRKSGLLLFVLGMTLYSSMAMMDLKTEPVGGLSSGFILKELGSDVRAALLDPDPAMASDETAVAGQAISGGYAGAIQYTLLYMLFGYFGSRFVMVVMFAISIMLMTGKSYVELAGVMRKRGGHMLSLLRAKLFPPGGRVAKQSSKSGTTSAATLLDDDDLDDDDEELPVEPARRPRRKLPFFSWFTEQPASTGDGAEPDNEWMIEEERSVSPGRKKAVPIASQWQDDEDDDEVGSWQSYAQQDEEEQGTLDSDKLPWQQDAGQPGANLGPAADTAWPLVGNEPGDQLDELDDYREDAEENELHEGTQPSARSPLLDSPALAADDSNIQPELIRPLPVKKPYQLPPFSLLSKPSGGGRGGEGLEANDARRKLEATLESFGVKAKVLDVVRGPAVTRYEVQPATGVKVSRIVGLTDDIALALAAKDIRMEAPIPGKSAIGIEVPNMEVSVVTMREVMETPSFQGVNARLSIAFGRDISGQPIVGNLAKMPHLLVAGATGSGKSVCINGIITSILYKARPDEVKFLMIDPKMVELNMYNGIPHLLAPVVTDPRRASLALKKIVVEMEKRYELFSKSGTRNIEGYNTLMADNPAAVLPFIVVIVDELADLMMVAAGDVEDAITRLAQMARAAGIHLIIATQRPSVDVITGVIKANIPSRIAFGVSSQVDSRTILDMVGAEKLLGRGDMLFLPVGMSKPIRVQGAFLSDAEVEAVVNFSRGQAEAEYKEDLVPELDESDSEQNEQLDELFDQAVRIVLEAKQASVSLLQRRMRVGYNRAARLIDQMEAKSVIGPYEGSKPREVLMSLDQYDAGKISS
ncbi:FtsK/SpoIIIE family DNA translocase [Paenibacillus methanolicus]|uniref:S-DNA-T family DNA segregation ATPase FtsK/SpoIIIE n=1 Tax=Paenibacillus methanolicus TaxID=582686 RepID=A0A5S5CHU3_9BACL|nr:DNA translocase FtsK [Paenibacillus methanolicus]TYP77593.1 S-DNA-T family DNA segregation ATPase FtsK/SpoIIIE [Paenibacillus methanolicus]